MPGTGDAIELFELATGATNIIYSKDQTRAYVANAAGDVDVYNLLTHQKIATWIVGNVLAGMSLSDDGDFLLATENPSGPISTLYRVNTATGAVETFTHPGNGFRDVEIVNGNLALLTGGGTNILTTFNLTTGAFSTIAGGVAHSNFSAIVEGSRYALFAEPLTGDGRLFLYDKYLGSFVADGTSYDGATGDNFGIVAINETAGMVLQGIYYDSLNIYDLNLDIVGVRHFSGPIGGIAFDPNGEFVYLYMRESGNIDKYHVADWALVESIQVGASTFNSNRSEFGNQLMIEGNGQWLTLKTNDGTVKQIDLRIRDEIFHGTTGADAFDGGKGNDTYYIDHAGDTIVERLYEGTDIAVSSISYVLPSYVENLLLTGGAAINGTGNALGNNLYGNTGANILDGGDGADSLSGDAGDDSLYGGEGNDTLSGGEGNDLLVAGAGLDTLDGGSGINRLYGGAGNDSYYVASLDDTVFEEADGGNDLVIASSNFYLHANVERLLLMDGGDYFGVGNGLSNFVFGNSGANLLIAGGGFDTVRGGDGNDTIYGQDGNDQIYGDAGNDYVAGGAGIDTIEGGEGADALYGEADNDVLRGGGGADLLFGGDGDDYLDGASGLGEADLLDGGAGGDNYVVDSAQDLIFEAADAGRDSVNASVGYYLFANIEVLTLAFGAGDIFAVGNELDNAIIGNEGLNLIIAGAGVDSVLGGAGADSVFGQEGADSLYGEAGVDYLVGGAGNDFIHGGLDADALYGEDGHDVLVGGEGFFTDILIGGAGNDELRGDSGLGDYDRMDGGSGDDLYVVDTGDDLTFEAADGGTDTVHANVAGTNSGVYLYANVENLVLLGTTTFGVGNELANDILGNASVNLLLGGAGNDRIAGGKGNDVLFGEGGADRFVFDQGTGGDVIGDFAAGTDKIDLSAFGFADFQAVKNSMHQNGGTTAIDLGNGDFVVVNGVAMSAFSAGDFILAPGSSAKGELSIAGAVSWDDPVILHDLPGDDFARLDISHVEMWHGASDWVPLLL